MKTPTRRRTLALALALATLVVGGLLVWFVKSRPRFASEEQCQAVLAWLEAQVLERGAVHSLALPDPLAEFAADGQVHAERLEDGRLCFLLEASIGYKDNFEGTLYCDAPVGEGDLYADPSGATAVSLGSGPPLEELFVRSREGPSRLAVYFDLN